jgi:hypothetical protein
MKIKPTSAEARFLPFLEFQTKNYQEVQKITNPKNKASPH